MLALAGCEALFHVEDIVDARSDTVVATGPRVVFVTANTYGPDFQGLLGAHAKCQDEANQQPSRTPGSYRAWLSTLNVSPAEFIGEQGGPFVLSDGITVVANDWQSLTTKELLHAIDMAPDGTLTPQQPCDVWTNTSANSFPVDGTDVASDCYDWSTSMQGVALGVGYSHATMAIWSDDANDCVIGVACTGSAHLYCFQQ
jgi:hypothetical protein